MGKSGKAHRRDRERDDHVSREEVARSQREINSLRDQLKSIKRAQFNQRKEYQATKKAARPTVQVTPKVGDASSYDPTLEKSTTLMQQLDMLTVTDEVPETEDVGDLDLSSFVAPEGGSGPRLELLSRERREGYSYLGLSEGEELWMSTALPFTAVLTGVQGSGKSYSSMCLLENLLIHAPPMCGGHSQPTLVLHYDRSRNTYCEAVSLALESRFAGVTMPRVTVLVSPDNYLERSQHHYAGLDIDIQPLLFAFDEIDAHDLNVLMGLQDAGRKPLYAAGVMNVLRRFQRTGRHPSWADFLELVGELDLNPSQVMHLQQRMDMLSSIMRDAEPNTEFRDKKTLDETFGSDVVIVDLTDSLIDPEFAGNVFSIMVQHFINRPGPAKTIFLDEAHKYMTSTALCDLLVQIVRQQRHLGTRMIISTQSPATIPDEALELANLVLLHAFHSPAWAEHLTARLNLGMDTGELMDEVSDLMPGHGILFDSAGLVSGEQARIRRRISRDVGSSKVGLGGSG